jgi:release factor glutamine methyltransferase
MEFANFAGLSLLLAPGAVMTPRATTEALVDAAVALAGDRRVRIADVGTGSGAIAVALAVALPSAEIFATDTSPAAVELARQNVSRLGLANRVTVAAGSLLDPVPGDLDLVVANLPYLPLSEIGRDDDLRTEPAEAVYAPGNGLGPYRRLLEASTRRLQANGSLVLQLRRRVLTAPRDGLDALAGALA